MKSGWYVAAAAALMAASVTLAEDVVIPVPATVPAAVASVSGTIVQRDGEVLRLLNTTIRGADGKEVKHVDVAITFTVDAEGKVRAEVTDQHPTTVVGVDALVPAVYTDGKTTFEVRGPAMDVDLRPTWTIRAKGFNATVVSGPPKGHPNLVGAKGIDTLPEGGLYGIASHEYVLPGVPTSTRTLVNARQVDDTLVITGYAQERAGDKYVQTAVVVLKRKEPLSTQPDKVWEAGK